jgi:hypothetical protein
VLAGGFAENRYLFSEVKKFADATGGIQVRSAADCWSSVVKGAVLAGTGIGMELPVRLNSCLRHYGITVPQSHLIGQYTGSQIALEVLGEGRISGFEVGSVPYEVIWLVRRGDLISREMIATQTIKVRCTFAQKHYDSQRVVRIGFIAAAARHPPSMVYLPSGMLYFLYLSILEISWRVLLPSYLGRTEFVPEPKRVSFSN